MQRPIFIYAAVLLWMSQIARAGNLPEAMAFDASMEAVAQVFSSPALPSLDNERGSITPLYGIVSMKGVDETAYVSTGEKLAVSNWGKLKGDVAGLTFNYSWGDLGFFILVAGSQVKGHMKTTTTNASLSIDHSNDIQDIKAKSAVGAAGLNWRFAGNDKSFFAMGIFGGPATIQSQTSARFVHPDQTSTEVSVNPSMSAMYIGLQMMFRLGEFRINPYVNSLGSTESECLKPKYKGDPYPVGQMNKCKNGQSGFDSYSYINGAGFNVGYGRFIFGLSSQANGSNRAFKATPLMLSFRASF